MADSTLAQAQQLVDQLTPHDQVRLLAYLTTRLAQVVSVLPPIPVGPHPRPQTSGRPSSSSGRGWPPRTPQSMRRSPLRYSPCAGDPHVHGGCQCVGQRV